MGTASCRTSRPGSWSTRRISARSSLVSKLVGSMTSSSLRGTLILPSGVSRAPWRFSPSSSLSGARSHAMGITGYPESHPTISDDLTVQAMWDKRQFATYIVSNLCFDGATVRRWIRRVRDRGVTLPIFVGLAGPVERAQLVKVATKIGVGESARFLSGHAGWFLRMGAPGGYNPSRLLERTASALADPASGIEGVHIFTFNQIPQSEQWRQSVLASV